MIVSIKRLMTWCTCVAKAKDRGRLSSLQSSSFLSSGTSSTLVFVKDGWELNFPLLDRFQVINRCKVAQFATLQQYVQGDGCMIQDCWSYLPKDWWWEAEELFHLWSQDTEQSFTFAFPATVSSEVNLLLCNTIQLYAIWSDLFWGNIKRFMSEVKDALATVSFACDAPIYLYAMRSSHLSSFLIPTCKTEQVDLEPGCGSSKDRFFGKCFVCMQCYHLSIKHVKLKYLLCCNESCLVV